MPKFLIEREVPGAEKMSPPEVQAVARRANQAVEDLGQIQWIHSYVMSGRVYCVYIAPNEELIREHARLAGMPVTKVWRVGNVIDPTAAEARAA